MRRPGFNGTVLAACWLVFVTGLPSVATHSLQQSGAIVAEAAMRSDIEALRDLLRDGADANASQGDGMSALHWAARNGDSDLAEALIYAGANLAAATSLGHLITSASFWFRVVSGLSCLMMELTDRWACTLLR